MGLGFRIDLKLSGKLNWNINYHHTKNQVDQSTPTHFLSDLFFLIAIRPVDEETSYKITKILSIFRSTEGPGQNKIAMV